MSIDPKSYSLGYVRGCSDEREQYRVAAFGAIRRAVELARQADWAWEVTGDPCMKAAAYDVRRAIRAAIGSPKA